MIFFFTTGLHVVYDLSQPEGQRVKNIKVKCADCEIPEFVDLEPSKIYKIVMSSFLATGGDGYSVIPDNTVKRHLFGEFLPLLIWLSVRLFLLSLGSFDWPRVI